MQYVILGTCFAESELFTTLLSRLEGWTVF